MQIISLLYCHVPVPVDLLDLVPVHVPFDGTHADRYMYLENGKRGANCTYLGLPLFGVSDLSPARSMHADDGEKQQVVAAVSHRQLLL